ncbi:SURF1 family protein [Roseomonas sp. 18066]|uniref:SURF1 family protein n=1 Tax=Roseomonas sp. 18066 TaxID=2681412 RepID=UPI00190FBB40|nr:SURF1 family protein [Roseomonas sp. 18066]
MTTTTEPAAVGPRPASPARLGLLLALAMAGIVALLALGTWQVERRAWKLALIDRIESRVNAPALAAPGPAEWPGIDAASAEYRHVALAGRFLPGPDRLVQAATLRGAGFWVLAPFRSDAGFTVLVNRGFVGAEQRDPAARATDSTPQRLTGLLRITEPGGGFLRSNDPAAGRWYSRDVAALAADLGLDGAPGGVAPYFVDQAAGPDPAALPVGGMTVIRFNNNHLVYAATWFTLALMLAGAASYLIREEWRARRR